jgi:myo-inositol-1(or 4)-monophosphatase
VSLGIIVNKELVAGVVHAPFLSKVYYAAKGEGAFCNGSPIKASLATDINEVLIATGFPYLNNRETWFSLQLKRIEKVGRAANDIRRNGACSIDLCRVADGTFGGFFETVQPWDIAAGQLICKEAGAKIGHFSKFNSEEHKLVWENFAKKRGLPYGLIQDITSNELRSDDYFVAAEGIFHELQKLLSE